MTAFKPMLAKDAVPEKLRYPLVVQKKLDGIRVCIVGGKALTRTLKEVPNREIFEALSRPEFDGLDGEIVVGIETAPDAYRRTSSFVMAPNKTGEPWCFHVFDSFSNPSDPFESRYKDAHMIVSGTTWTDFPMHMVVNQVAHNAAELEAIEEAFLAVGHEGVIVRDPAGDYKFGRSYPKDGRLLKVKRFIDFEARVVGVYEKMHNANEAVTNALGRTERSTRKEGMVPAGVLGGLELVAINGPHEGQSFRCGTGFDDEQRVAYWLSPEAPGSHIVGKTAKIKSFAIGVKDAPRFPVFLGWRDMGIDG